MMIVFLSTLLNAKKKDFVTANEIERGAAIGRSFIQLWSRRHSVVIEDAAHQTYAEEGEKKEKEEDDG